MDILAFIANNAFLLSMIVCIAWAQVVQYFSVKRHTKEINDLQQAHEENRKLIENIIRMEKDIQYISESIREIKQQLHKTT